MVVKPVNLHDTSLFDESLTNLLEIADDLSLDLENSCLTLDSGFDSSNNKLIIRNANMIPVIEPNRESMKNQEKINLMFEEFEEFDCYKPIYEQRYIIERTFAREDTYRKLVIHYEKLQSTFMGFRYLAYSMINFRHLFGRNSL